MVAGLLSSNNLCIAEVIFLVVDFLIVCEQKSKPFNSHYNMVLHDKIFLSHNLINVDKTHAHQREKKFFDYLSG